jgi:hypothetical protein
MRNMDDKTSLHKVNNISNYRYSSDGNLDVAPVPERENLVSNPGKHA